LYKSPITPQKPTAMSAEKPRQRENEPFKYTVEWASIRKNIQCELTRELDANPTVVDKFPAIMKTPDGKLRLPWTTGPYPYETRAVGNSSMALFIKILTYGIRFGVDRIKWIEDSRAREPESSFFGITEVFIPYKDRMAYCGLCDSILPLPSTLSKKIASYKTVVKNYEVTGLVEHVNRKTMDTEILFDRCVFLRLREQYIRADVKRKDKRAAQAAAETTQPPSAIDIVRLCNPTDVPAVHTSVELNDAKKRLEKAEEWVRNARLRVSSAMDDLRAADKSREEAKRSLADLQANSVHLAE